MSARSRMHIEIISVDNHEVFGTISNAAVTEQAHWSHDGRYLDGGPWYEANGSLLDIDAQPLPHREQGDEG